MSEYRKVPLSNVVRQLEAGARPKGGVTTSGDVPSLGGEHINVDGTLAIEGVKRISNEFYDSMPRGRITFNDILIVKDGATTGKVALITADFPFARAAVNEHVFRLIIDQNKADPRYVFYFLRSPRGQREILKDFRGATVGGITRTFVDLVQLPLPKLTQQRRIADVLDKADAILRKRIEGIALSEELPRSSFLQMFGDPVTNPMSWPVKPLASVVREGTIVTYGIVQAGPHIEDGVPYIRTGDIKEGRIVTRGLLRTSPAIAARYQRSQVQQGDIVMSIRATVGTVAIVPAELHGANLTQGTAKISPGSDVTRDYLFEHIRAPGMQRWLRSQVKGATFKEITLGALRAAPVMVPPRDFQAHFSEICARHRMLAHTQVCSRKQANLLFDSLVDRAFRGEA